MLFLIITIIYIIVDYIRHGDPSRRTWEDFKEYEKFFFFKHVWKGILIYGVGIPIAIMIIIAALPLIL